MREREGLESEESISKVITSFVMCTRYQVSDMFRIRLLVRVLYHSSKDIKTVFVSY